MKTSLSSTARDAPQNFAAGSYVLSDGLARHSLAHAAPDSHLKLAWVNSVSFVFVIIGEIGLNPPKATAEPIAQIDESVPASFELPPIPATELEPQPEESPANPHPLEPPQIVTLVATDLAATAFAAPVVEATALVPAHLASAPPANPLQLRPAPAPPRTTTLSSTGGGGDFPEPTCPKIARQRGYQGSVLVYIEVDKQGAVTKAELKKSSGHALLDEHCVSWIQQRYVFPPRQFRKHYCPFTFKLK